MVLCGWLFVLSRCLLASKYCPVLDRELQCKIMQGFVWWFNNSILHFTYNKTDKQAIHITGTTFIKKCTVLSVIFFSGVDLKYHREFHLTTPHRERERERDFLYKDQFCLIPPNKSSAWLSTMKQLNNRGKKEVCISTQTQLHNVATQNHGQLCMTFSTWDDA